MVKFLYNVRKSYQAWQERRFLKKHGCKSREQYDRRHDPDINNISTRIRDYYHGYNYVYCFENTETSIYDWDLGYSGLGEVELWCQSNLSSKYRFDFHRVYKQTGIGSDGSTESEWVINEIGGGDYIFFACKDPEDFVIFRLKFS
jgi:hypothetical protein